MLYINVKIGEPGQSPAPEVRSDVPQQRPAWPSFSWQQPVYGFTAAPRRGRQRRAEARTGKVGQLPPCAVQSLQCAGEHIYQARSLEVFIPAAAAVLHTRELQSNSVTNPL